MTRRTSFTFLAAAVVTPLAALAVVGCGSGQTDASTAPPKIASGHANVGVADDGDLGKILVDSQGRTLYLFQKDSGTKSTCFGECANDWPPLRAAGTPTAGDEANASLVATTARSDGDPEITYNGHPLYLFEGDKGPGDANGQGLIAFGGGWFVLSPQGDQVSGQPSSGAGSSSGGGSGY